MEAIKKKMQAMKAEKDNLRNCCDDVELVMREARVSQNKTEEDAIMLTQK